MGNNKKVGTRSKCYKVRKPPLRTKPSVESTRPTHEGKPTDVPQTSEVRFSNRSFKVRDSQEYYKKWIGESMEYDIVDLTRLFQFFNDVAVCKNCSSRLSFEKRSIEGLAVTIKVMCNNCNESQSIDNCQKYVKPTGPLNEKKTYYDLNIRLVHGLRQIGKGLTAGRSLLGVMNLPPPPTKYKKYSLLLLSTVEELCRESMKKAAEQAIAMNDNVPDLIVAVDGTWQKRGHTSMNGVLTVTSAESCKVLDVSVMSKYCLCPKRDINNHEQSCAANYLGTSGGMEVHGTLETFRRSEALYNARYVNFLGDGDSKAFDAVQEAKVYGDDVQFKKLECIGHVQKRMGKRLLKLKSVSGKVKLEDGKGLGGQGRLSEPNIQKLQTYYGLAIRRNVQSVEEMRKAIWAVYFHTMSSNNKPAHQLCPKDNETWCKYNLSLLTNEKYDHDKHFHIPECVMSFIKPIFKDLSETKLLERCLKGKTQNQNESLNSVIWSLIPKRTFVTLPTLKFGVYSAVCSFNDGFSSKLQVLEALNLRPGKNFVKAMQRLEIVRVKEADKKVQELEKKIRNKRALKRKRLEDMFAQSEDPDNPSYSSGNY